MITISKDAWSPIARRVGKFAVANLPKICGYTGIAGFLIAIGLTYKNAADIHDGIKEKDAKKVAKKTLPIAAAATASAVAIHYGMKESDKRLAAAMAAYSLSDAAYSELKDSINSTLSKKKINEIEHNANNALVEKNKTVFDDVDRLECIGTGQMLVLEKLTGRVFRADSLTVERAILETNKALLEDGIVKLSDLHYAMGLDCTSDLDNRICWNYEHHKEIGFMWDMPDEQPDHMPVAVLVYKRYGIIDPYLNFTPLD